MQLPSGKLAENNEENASFFVPHLEKVLNAVKKVDWKVLSDIKLRETMFELDGAPT